MSRQLIKEDQDQPNGLHRRAGVLAPESEEIRIVMSRICLYEDGNIRDAE